MKLIGKYKWYIIVFFLLCIAGVLWLCRDLFFVTEGPLYGNRLEGIGEVPINNDAKKSVSDFLLSKDGIKKVSTNIHGKIADIVISVDETMTFDNIKGIANEALSKFSTEQKSFYDISFLVDYASESTKTDFPRIGYKNRKSDVIVW